MCGSSAALSITMLLSWTRRDRRFTCQHWRNRRTFCASTAGSEIGAYAKIGNFVEPEEGCHRKGTKASHLSYLGDAVIGCDVNIAQAPYSAIMMREKHQTIIGDNVFVGSDTQFVAPVKIGKGAYIGAGSTITKDVLPGSLAVSRTEQRIYPDGCEQKKKKAKGLNI